MLLYTWEDIKNSKKKLSKIWQVLVDLDRRCSSILPKVEEKYAHKHHRHGNIYAPLHHHHPEYDQRYAFHTHLHPELQEIYANKKHKHDGTYAKIKHKHPELDERYAFHIHKHPEYLMLTDTAYDSTRLNGLKADKYSREGHVHLQSVYAIRLELPAESNYMIADIEFPVDIEDTEIISYDRTKISTVKVEKIDNNNIYLSYTRVAGTTGTGRVVILYWTETPVFIEGKDHVVVKTDDVEGYPNSVIRLHSTVKSGENNVDEGKINYSVGDK